MTYNRRGLPTLRQRLIATMLYHVRPLPESKEQQAQVLGALEAAYLMGRRDEIRDKPNELPVAQPAYHAGMGGD